MRSSIVFFAILALGAAIPPPVQKQRAADQALLAKQQDVITLLQHITEEIPNEQLQNLGQTYDIEANVQQYENPIIVKYYAGVVKNGLVQPKGTVYSNSVGQLRKEVALLTRILLGAKDYQTFLATAAWARVSVNEHQFVKAFTAAVLQRQDTQGIILPSVYEIFPNLFFDGRIMNEVQHIINKGIDVTGQQQFVIPINYTAHLPHGEQQLTYFTHDIGLQAWYNYIQLAGYILPQTAGEPHEHHQIGHGSQYYYLHQQLLAHYELERYSHGLGEVPEVDIDNVQVPYNAHLRHINGLETPGRPEILQVGQNKQHLAKLVKQLENRLLDAIDAGYVKTGQDVLLSLYQPQGLNILGDLIEGTGRSVNPRYYGSLVSAAKQLLGNAPHVENIYEYTPSALELGESAIGDPVFYQLYKKVINLFKHYQNSLPAYQYNDLVLPGVNIQKVDFSKLVTYFNDYYVNLDNAAVHPGVGGQQQQQQQQEQVQIKGLLQRLDHKPYNYQIVVQSEKPIPNVVVRVYLGPKYNHEGQPISISENRHQFVELDQFVHDLQQGQNVIVRNSQQSPSHSHDWPSVQNIKQRVNSAVRSQEPLYITEPQQIFGWPARLALPKGHANGLPLQIFVVITQPGQQNVQYGPVVPQDVQTYQSQYHQVVGMEEYAQAQGQKGAAGIQQTVDVLPIWENVKSVQEAQEIQTHGANFYTKQQGVFPWSVLHQHHGVQQVHSGQQYQQYAGQQQVSQQVGYGQQLHGQQLHGQQYVHGSGVGGLGGLGGYGTHGYAGVGGQVGVGGQSGIVGQGGVGGQVGVAGQGVVGGVSGYGVGGIRGGVTGGISDVGQGQHIFSSGQQHLSGFQGIYPIGKVDSYISEYYGNKHISEIIGGGISLDGKPLGFPLDRPLGLSALFVPNIHIQDVYVYHEDQPVSGQTLL